MLKEFVNINELNLDNKVYLALKRSRYETVGDIINGLKSSAIYNVRNIGEKSIADIIKAIEVQEDELGQFFKILIDSDLQMGEERVLTCRLVSKNREIREYSIDFIMRRKTRYSSFVLYKKPYSVFPFKESFISEAVKAVIVDFDKKKEEALINAQS